MFKKISIIVIVGPTASGKSDLAVYLAKKYNGEIISADSRQIYQKLSIGTAKIRGVWRNGTYNVEGICHYCIDFVSPKKVFSVADFQQCGTDAILAITAKGKIPIITGGTGLWIDTLVHGIELPHVPPNMKLRAQLEKKSPAELFMLLSRIDSRRARSIEKENPRRLIRAIEIAHVFGHVPLLTRKKLYRTLWIGISRDTKILNRMIIRRSRAMIRHGLVAETKNLLKSGIRKKRIHEFGFEYTAALNVIEKKIIKTQLPDILAMQTMRYAKRQMRWFKRNHEIHWIKTHKNAEKFVQQFLN